MHARDIAKQMVQGAALGSHSERVLDFLEYARSNIRTTQTVAQIAKAIRKARGTVADAVRLLRTDSLATSDMGFIKITPAGTKYHKDHLAGKKFPEYTL